jgi:hypothetical protein
MGNDETSHTPQLSKSLQNDSSTSGKPWVVSRKKTLNLLYIAPPRPRRCTVTGTSTSAWTVLGEADLINDRVAGKEAPGDVVVSFLGVSAYRSAVFVAVLARLTGPRSITWSLKGKWASTSIVLRHILGDSIG